MSARRYGLRALAVVAIAALGLAAGIWLNLPPDRAPRSSVDVSSPQQVAALLPAAGEGRFRERHDGDRIGVLASVQDCAPVPVVQQFRTGNPVAFAGYTVDQASTVRVSVARMAPEDVAPVQDALRSATHCERPIEDTETAWVKIARSWFGDASALFAETSVDVHPDQGYLSNLTGGPVWTFTTSGEWLVAIGAYATPLETVAEIYPSLLAKFDREVGTEFLEPGESSGGCRPPNLAVEGLPANALGRQEVMALQGMHDAACTGRADWVRAVMSRPMVVDDGIAADPGALDLSDPAEFARVLETRGVYRNGAVSYRLGDSALVFSTLYAGGYNFIAWDAYVRQCSAAAPLAAQMCGPDPYGLLGGADWQALLSARGCLPEEKPFGVVEHAQFRDLTADGRPDAVLVVGCSLEDGGELREVQVYDGGSPPGSPALIQALLGGDPGPEGTGLLPDTATLAGDELTVESWTWRGLSRADTPNVWVTDRFRWRDGAFTPEAREVELVR
jgi:hypothetical protein